MDVLRNIKICSKQIGPVKNENCKFTNRNLLFLFLLFPFFEVKNAFQYQGSSLSKLFDGKKDTFYRFLNNGRIKWRELLLEITLQLLKLVKDNTNIPEKDRGPKCLIVDDTDIPKTGMTTEFIGKVFSHKQHRFILGYKCQTLTVSDGKSQFIVNFSLHGEKGSREERPYGLTKKQLANRFASDTKGQAVQKRKAEYVSHKPEVLMDMVNDAVERGIEFDYLLADSWYITKKLCRFITSLKRRCNLLGMMKIGIKTLYKTELGTMTANELVRKMVFKKMDKTDAELGCRYCAIKAEFAGMPVKLFFIDRGHDKWYGLLSTDTSLSFGDAFKLYSRRWSIEVSFKDCKTHLKLGKCQSRSFAAQIASITLTFMQYNMLSFAKRFNSYETLGGLFADVVHGTVELSVTEKIWAMIKRIIKIVAELLSSEEPELLQALMDYDSYINKIADINKHLNAS